MDCPFRYDLVPFSCCCSCNVRMVEDYLLNEALYFKVNLSGRVQIVIPFWHVELMLLYVLLYESSSFLSGRQWSKDAEAITSRGG